MTATLTAEPLTGGTLVTVDCEHGTTEVGLLNGEASGITAADAVRVARSYLAAPDATIQR